MGGRNPVLQLPPTMHFLSEADKNVRVYKYISPKRFKLNCVGPAFKACNVIHLLGVNKHASPDFLFMQAI
jgi:hypothetical protein